MGFPSVCRVEPSVSNSIDTLVLMPSSFGRHQAGWSENRVAFPGSPLSPYMPHRSARRKVVLPEPFSALSTVSGLSGSVEGSITTLSKQTRLSISIRRSLSIATAPRAVSGSLLW